ncbi:MFS transporter [Angustibacter sp. Root456]|uniref:MFS transporter n=1 Tax=Angustibacter sp. Root456 TaxID=1736539 RepID=UPI0006FE90F4|nr:MFS transporter [Angustibacter sp. Root456]KQX66560.1 MFS transporter [Angustibacter sp. Root456]
MPDGVAEGASSALAGLRTGESRGRWVLLATVLGSGMAMLDATVVTIALPAIGRDLGSGLSGLQWTLNGYTLTLAAFILVGGSVGDLWGRRRVFVMGTVAFALTSALCAVAPSVGLLVAARVLQGVAGALLTPGSLAIISSSFHRDDRAAAIGAWSGLSGVTTAVGPFVGGWLIEHASWRWIFLINLPLALAVVLVSLRHVPESSDPDAVRQLDLPGALAGVAWLAALTFGLIRWGAQGLDGAVLAALVVTAVALVGFIEVERRGRQPMMPLSIFASRRFSATNAVTFVVYGALSAVLFVLALQLQIVCGFTPLAAGAAFLPVTFLMLLGSAQVGRWSERWGPRAFMTVGPLVCAGAMVLLAHLVTTGASYWRDVLPPVVVFGVGLTLTVAPLTTTVLAAAPTRHAGLASGVNNAVARTAGLLAVAVLPLAAGLAEGTFRDVRAFDQGFDRAMFWCALLLALGGLLSAALIGPRGQVARGGTLSPT